MDLFWLDGILALMLGYCCCGLVIITGVWGFQADMICYWDRSIYLDETRYRWFKLEWKNFDGRSGLVWELSMNRGESRSLDIKRNFASFTFIRNKHSYRC